MRTILILGAGVYQVPLIKKAKEMGLKVIVTSIKGNYPGFQYADKIYYENTTDKERILQIAKTEKINAVATTGTDVAVSTLGYICDHLSLPGIGEHSAQLVTDKAAMKKAFQKCGVHTAQFHIVHSLQEAEEVFEEMNASPEKPVLLKIVDKSGSRGIIKILYKKDVKAAWNKASAISDKNYMVMEQYIDGKEIGIDAFVRGGLIEFLFPHDKYMFKNNEASIPIGHKSPIECDEETLKRIHLETYKVINGLKLDDCAVNIDAFIQKDGEISIIEAAGRCGATGIPEVICAATGIDYYAAIIKNALGEPIEFNNCGDLKCCSYKLLFSQTKGILRSVDIPQIKGAQVHLDIGLGDRLEVFSNGTQRIGHVLFQAENMAKLDKIVNEFDQKFSLTIESE